MQSTVAANAVAFVSQVMAKAGLPMAAATLQMDSTAVRSGDIFVAIPGAKFDGRFYLDQMAAKGARAALWDNTGFEWPQRVQIPHFAVPGLKQQVGVIAAALLNNPSQAMHVFAFTGTSGKTTCTTWAAQLLQSLGEPCASIGTRGAGLPNQLTPFGLTTPQATDLQQWFAQFANQQLKSCAIEASSIGLAEGRLNGTHITTALFTNLTQDHLDYHGDMQRYGAAKAALFSWPNLKQVVLNADDPLSAAMLSNTDPSTDIVVIGIANHGSNGASEKIQQLVQLAQQSGLVRSVKALWAHSFEYATGQTQLQLAGDFGQACAQLGVPGQFNISNALMASACALLRGFSLGAIAQQWVSLVPVEGRMQALGGHRQPLVVVDYAHKPDALEQVLASLKTQASARGGQLICVMGCGGDRDASKRPVMGAIAARLANRVIVTSDNPRSESPQDIIAQIVNGLGSEVTIEADRAKAISLALKTANQYDIVLIAGKGHEDYQEIQGVKYPFSDLTQAEQALQLYWNQA